MTDNADLAEAYRTFLVALRDIQVQEDAYAQGALNGQFFVERLNSWEPHFRRTLADVLAFHGAVHHKLYWMREISTYAARRCEQPADAVAVMSLYDGNVDGLGAEAAAERYYRLALMLHQDCAVAHFGLGCLLADRDDADGAIGHFDNATRLNDHYAPFGDFRAAELLQKLGRPADALPRWRRAAASGHVFGQHHYRIALALRDAGDAEAALSQIEKALDCAHYYAPEFTELRIPIPNMVSTDDPAASEPCRHRTA